VEVKAQHEEASRAILQQAAELLKEIVESGDPPKMLAQKLDEIDEPFFAVLSANIQEAQRQNHDQAVQTLQLIGNMAMGMLQERAKAQAEMSQPAPEPKIHLPR
jgi:hypothetical protein